MVTLVHSLKLHMPFYLILGAYYASKTIIRGLINNGGHLITQVRKNAVAYLTAPISPEKRRYGEKIRLKTLFHDPSSLIEIPNPAYSVLSSNFPFFIFSDLLSFFCGCWVVSFNLCYGIVKHTTTILDLCPDRK